MDLPNDKDNSVYSYMNWDSITCKTSNQFKLKQKYEENYDSNGLADIKGKKVIALIHLEKLVMKLKSFLKKMLIIGVQMEDYMQL